MSSHDSPRRKPEPPTVVALEPDRSATRRGIAFLSLNGVFAVFDIALGSREGHTSSVITTNVIVFAVLVLLVYLVAWRQIRWVWTVTAGFVLLSVLGWLATVIAGAPVFVATRPHALQLVGYMLLLASFVLWFTLRPTRYRRGHRVVPADHPDPCST
jgi:hypothetical protein